MLKTPPHILVTTPESLYLLLTAERSRTMLRTARVVIVDEIHAVIGSRRGAHLALSLERLQRIAERPLLRIGLSATQKPIDQVAAFLIGGDRDSGCTIVDRGHHRAMDLALELPNSTLEAVMAHEVWAEYYDRLTALIGGHRTTLVFVNTRRMAERLARELSERLGEEAVTAHHGSLSKEKRLDAETRLKSGQLRALVATASLELGIDIGAVDLVCQIGSPHRIATLLQRVGRSGHSISGTPKGRLFPTSRDDLVECIALLRTVCQGELDRIVSQEAPLDVLAQQMVAETASGESTEDDLFELTRRAWPYRSLTRARFDEVVTMIAEGFATRRGRRSALVHRDEVNRKLRGRRGSRLLALTSGGAIPELADYRVVLDPEETFIGTLNEDFAIESTAGDVFQLGNASWQVLQVGAGVVRVADAKGAPPTLPFWLGEAPARSDELSRAVSDLRAEIEARLKADATSEQAVSGVRPTVIDWLVADTGVSVAAAEQILAYFSESRRMLGLLPTQDAIVLERFFDESGGMQLVLHAPFGSRINKAWGLALRKRFCRQFNFELQAAASEDALLLSLGPQHSFPLTDVFRYLHSATAREVLVQAFLDAPVFKTRWRWNANISLAVPRYQGGRKTPPQIQRMMAEDLMAAAFPDAAACLENIPGDRRIPDHPLVAQTVSDCLEEAMDYPGLAAILDRIHRGEIRCTGVDTPEPSPLAHEILNARPYSFLDDAPLEERRAHAVYARRANEPSAAGDMGALDLTAIERVRDEERPAPRDADELHDVLLTAGFVTAGEATTIPRSLFETLERAGRAARAVLVDDVAVWICAERLPELRAVHPTLTLQPAIEAPASRAARVWSRDDALAEILRGRMAVVGPITAATLAESMAIGQADVDEALLRLEADGAILRGAFETRGVEWCDRRLLARIHRYTLNRLRAEIEPVSPADFMRFVFAWQHLAPSDRLSGTDGVRFTIEQLAGFEAPAAAWEQVLLRDRVEGYDPTLLDTLCLTGEVAWARVSSPGGEAPTVVAATPIALFPREQAAVWIREAPDLVLPPHAAAVLATLRSKGACFSHELRATCGLTDGDLDEALARLVGAGLIAADGFGGLRALMRSSGSTRPSGAAPARGPRRANVAGRWSALHSDRATEGDATIELHARALLRRYGIMFRRLLAREACAPPWRDLARFYRTLEARGEIRGGRFVSGMSGEQFALPEAVERVREIRRTKADGRPLVISAADPLNLVGIVTAGDRIRVAASTRILYCDGTPLAVLEGEYLRTLAEVPPAIAPHVATTLAGRALPPVLSGFVGSAG